MGQLDLTDADPTGVRHLLGLRVHCGAQRQRDVAVLVPRADVRALPVHVVVHRRAQVLVDVRRDVGGGELHV